MLQEAMSKLPKTEAEYHLKRCIDSGLWVANAADLVGAEEKEEETYEEIKESEKKDSWETLLIKVQSIFSKSINLSCTYKYSSLLRMRSSGKWDFVVIGQDNLKDVPFWVSKAEVLSVWVGNISSFFFSNLKRSWNNVLSVLYTLCARVKFDTLLKWAFTFQHFFYKVIHVI